jgi:putative redox protein
MHIKIESTPLSPFSLTATNESGQTLNMDAAPSLGGADSGFRPMEMVATALAGCSSIDVIHILRKMRQEPRDLKISVEAKREEGKEPSLFEQIHLRFEVFGNVTEDALKKALSLSFEKYCSVSAILRPTCNITYEYHLHP